jgi:hypothetical protein
MLAFSIVENLNIIKYRRLHLGFSLKSLTVYSFAHKVAKPAFGGAVIGEPKRLLQNSCPPCQLSAIIGLMLSRKTVANATYFSQAKSCFPDFYISLG